MLSFPFQNVLVSFHFKFSPHSISILRGKTKLNFVRSLQTLQSVGIWNSAINARRQMIAASVTPSAIRRRSPASAFLSSLSPITWINAAKVRHAALQLNHWRMVEDKTRQDKWEWPPNCSDKLRELCVQTFTNKLQSFMSFSSSSRGGHQRNVLLQRTVRGGELPNGVPRPEMHLSVRDDADCEQGWHHRMSEWVCLTRLQQKQQPPDWLSISWPFIRCPCGNVISLLFFFFSLCADQHLPEGKSEPLPSLTYVDPAMIMILVVMALMFIIICVVLRLFSRWVMHTCC